MDIENEDAPLTPQQMLALVEDQQRTVAGRMAAFVPWILVAWGIAWLAGFLVLWVDASQRPGTTQPSLWAGLTFGLLLAVAGIASAVLGIRSDRGLRGTRENAIVGIVYGNLWWLGSFAIWAIGLALAKAGMPGALLGIFYPSAFIFYAGIMYVMSGLIWRAYPMMVLGVWSVVISAAGAFVPQPTHYLVYALAGGGAFLLVAGWSAWWVRAARRRVAVVGGDRG
ncbi:MAG: hypothetical protein WA971_00060 [Microbacterium sp.]